LEIKLSFDSFYDVKGISCFVLYVEVCVIECE